MSMTVTAILIAAAAGTVAPVILTYNKLVANEQAYKTAFSGIDVELRRRLDLIPNLLETAKRYMAHERDTLEAVVSAREGMQQATQKAAQDPGNTASLQKLNQAEQTLSHAMKGLSVKMEAYPDLKASSTMLELMQQLSDTESRIANHRQRFNSAVETYNTHRQSFPAVLIAPMFGHNQNAERLSLGDEETLQKAPTLNF